MPIFYSTFSIVVINFEQLPELKIYFRVCLPCSDIYLNLQTYWEDKLYWRVSIFKTIKNILDSFRKIENDFFSLGPLIVLIEQHKAFLTLQVWKTIEYKYFYLEFNPNFFVNLLRESPISETIFLKNIQIISMVFGERVVIDSGCLRLTRTDFF